MIIPNKANIHPSAAEGPAFALRNILFSQTKQQSTDFKLSRT